MQSGLWSNFEHRQTTRRDRMRKGQVKKLILTFLKNICNAINFDHTLKLWHLRKYLPSLPAAVEWVDTKCIDAHICMKRSTLCLRNFYYLKKIENIINSLLIFPGERFAWEKSDNIEQERARETQRTGKRKGGNW